MALAVMSLKMLFCFLLQGAAQNTGSAGSNILALRGGVKPSYAAISNASVAVRALQDANAESVFPISNAQEVMQSWAALGDPMDVMTSGLEALLSVVSMDEPSLLDVAQAVGSFGLELLSTANPLLGQIVTFFSGLMMGIFGDDEPSTSMYQQILQAANKYTDEQLIKARLRECCQVGHGISAVLQTIRRGPLIEESPEWYEERYNEIHQQRGRVFGDCTADPDGDDCKTWQRQGGAIALDYALALATTEFNLLLHIIASRNPNRASDTTAADTEYAGCVVPSGWVRPYGDVAVSASGAVDCARQCKAGGYRYFGLECPMGSRVHCQCSNEIGGTSKSNEYCEGNGQPLVHSHDHCTGPYTADGYKFGDYLVSSVYHTDVADYTTTASPSSPDTVVQRLKQIIAEDGQTYVRMLYAHYNEFKSYRLGLVESASWDFNAEYQGAVKYTVTKTGGLQDGFTGESYSGSCTSITRGRVPCTQSASYFGVTYCTSRGTPSTTTGVCYSSGTGSADECGGSCVCCTQAMPCIRSEYDACTTQYKATLTQEMDAKYKARIDLLNEAVQQVQSQVTRGVRRV